MRRIILVSIIFVLLMVIIFAFYLQDNNFEERSWDESLKDFEEILDCINSSGIQVKTIKEVIQNEKRT